MDGIVLTDSGNYTMSLFNALSGKGYKFDVIATPAQLSRGNCGYALRFPEKFARIVMNTGEEKGIPIKGIYRIEVRRGKPAYIKLY